MNTTLLTRIPWAIVIVRLLLAPVLIALAMADASRMLLVALLATALWLDIVDGMLARLLGVDTPALRRADSRVDVLFFTATVICMAVLEPGLFTQLSLPIALLIVCECTCQLVSYLRFGCSTSTHSWLCKAWAVMLFGSVSLVLGKGVAGWPVQVTLLVGFLAYFEVMLMLLVAKQSPVDVPTAWHAWRTSQENARRVLH
jgi:CDP-diacylglycerol--glycerol-3-phosphate 3-phosphatidyltransferase